MRRYLPSDPGESRDGCGSPAGRHYVRLGWKARIPWLRIVHRLAIHQKSVLVAANFHWPVNKPPGPSYTAQRRCFGIPVIEGSDYRHPLGADHLQPKPDRAPKKPALARLGCRLPNLGVGWRTRQRGWSLAHGRYGGVVSHNQWLKSGIRETGIAGEAVRNGVSTRPDRRMKSSSAACESAGPDKSRPRFPWPGGRDVLLQCASFV